MCVCVCVCVCVGVCMCVFVYWHALACLIVFCFFLYSKFHDDHFTMAFCIHILPFDNFICFPHRYKL